MIVDSIFGRAARRPDELAVIHNGTPHSYRQFANHIAFAIEVFAAQGFAPGKMAIIWIRDLRLNWVVIHALRYLGITTLPVHNLRQVNALNIQNACCLVVAESEHRSQPTPPGIALVRFPDSEMANRQAGLSRPSRPPAPVGGHILYTSGTTGTYKKLLFEEDSAERDCIRMNAVRGWNEGTVYHNAYFPPFTLFGYKYPLMAWLSGACVVLSQGEGALLDIFEHGTTVAVAIPAMLDELVMLAEREQRKRASFELISSGGFLSSNLAEKVRLTITPNVTMVFGSTECSTVLLSRYREPENLHWFSVAPGRKVGIFGDDGRECATDETGEFGVRLEELDRTFYLDDPRASATTFRDGYFFPGDLAVRNAEGKVRILGRTADVINVGGRKQPVGPLEQNIQDFLKARNVCLFSRLNDAGRNEVVVAIEADAGPASAQVQAVKDYLRGFDDIRFFVAAALPRTDTAMRKINRRALRAMVFEETPEMSPEQGRAGPSGTDL